jgi:hypothetical protein
MTFIDQAEPLPLVPEELQRRHFISHPQDSRFRGAARLQQSLWRQRSGHGAGYYVGGDNKRHRLGTRLDQTAIANGANILDAAVRFLTRKEIHYRERGACIDQDRMWGNTLSSAPMTFNLLGNLKLDRDMANRFVETLFPDFAGSVVHVGFEHSPGRGDPTYTDDGTAFDAFFVVRRPDGKRLFIAIEVKFSESMTEAPARMRPRYDELSTASGLYQDPYAAELRANPYQQLWREHLLAQSMVKSGLFDGGAFVLIAPGENQDVQEAAAGYRQFLAKGDGLVPFCNVPLAQAVDAIGAAGGDMDQFEARYIDFRPVHEAIENHFLDAILKEP